MRYSILIIWAVFAACSASNAPPDITTLAADEWVLIQAYAGHMLENDRDGVGYAYRFQGGTPIQIYKHDPYADDVLATVNDTATVSQDLLVPISKMLDYYRQAAAGGCDWVERVTITWHLRRGTVREQYVDESCELEEMFEDHPLLPALRSAGWKQ